MGRYNFLTTRSMHVIVHTIFSYHDRQVTSLYDIIINHHAHYLFLDIKYKVKKLKYVVKCNY